MTATTRRLLLLLALACLLAATLVGGCKDASSSRGVSASLTGTSPRQPGGMRLLVTEMHGAFSVLLSVAPDRPDDRRTLLRIDHAPNYAPRASTSPAGEAVAYTVLPSGARSPDTEAVLWLVDLQERTPRRLAERLDLRIAPVWSPDGARVVIQRLTYGGPNGVEIALAEVDVRSAVSTDLARVTGPERLFPAGYAPDGSRFYYLRYSKGGAFLHSVELRSRAGRQIARVGDGAVRDIHVAPDGSSAVMLALEGMPGTYHAVGVDLQSGDVTPLLPAVSRTEDVGVAWKPVSPPVAAVGVVDLGTSPGAVVLADGTRVARAGAGFDVPVSWSPDGRMLYVRAFRGPSADDPGPEQPVVIDAEGVRRPITGAAPLEFVGWSDHGS